MNLSIFDLFNIISLLIIFTFSLVFIAKLFGFYRKSNQQIHLTSGVLIFLIFLELFSSRFYYFTLGGLNSLIFPMKYLIQRPVTILFWLMLLIQVFYPEKIKLIFITVIPIIIIDVFLLIFYEYFLNLEIYYEILYGFSYYLYSGQERIFFVALQTYDVFFYLILYLIISVFVIAFFLSSKLVNHKKIGKNLVLFFIIFIFINNLHTIFINWIFSLINDMGLLGNLFFFSVVFYFFTIIFLYVLMIYLFFKAFSDKITEKKSEESMVLIQKNQRTANNLKNNNGDLERENFINEFQKEKKQVDQDLIEKIMKSDKIKLDILREYLSMSQKEFLDNIFDWAYNFGLIIDAEELILNEVTKTDFINAIKRKRDDKNEEDI